MTCTQVSGEHIAQSRLDPPLEPSSKTAASCLDCELGDLTIIATLMKMIVMMKTVLLGALGVGVIALSACGPSGDAGSDDISIVAASYPFAFVAQEVVGDHATVQNLTKPGAEPHDLELRPKQVASVQSADLLVYSQGFQPAVDAAVDQAGLPTEHVVDAAEMVQERHADPHTWLNPLNQAKLATAIATKLAKIDPDHARDYRSNGRQLSARLIALDDKFTNTLKHCDLRTIVTSHAAFGYLTERYDLRQIAIAGINPSSEPAPSQLADIADLVRTENISTIFTESLASPAIAKTVASETGAKLDTLDPIEGLSAKTADENYLTLMQKNLRAIATANNCS